MDANGHTQAQAVRAYDFLAAPLGPNTQLKITHLPLTGRGVI